VKDVETSLERQTPLAEREAIYRPLKPTVDGIGVDCQAIGDDSLDLKHGHGCRGFRDAIELAQFRR